jgi:hypothetical protein
MLNEIPHWSHGSLNWMLSVECRMLNVRFAVLMLTRRRDGGAPG